MSRNIWVCLLLSLVTCGLYTIYWMVCANDEINNLSQTNGTSGIVVILLSFITCGIYGIFWYYQMGTRLSTANALHQQNGTDQLEIIFIILSILGFGLVALMIMQDAINKLVD